MNRRTFIAGIAATTITMQLPTHAAAQNVGVTDGALMRARREFMGEYTDLRTDAYLYPTLEEAEAGFRRFCEWAATTNPENEVVVENIEDITEKRDRSFGETGHPNYPHFERNVYDVRFYLGSKANDHWNTGVITMVLLTGPLVHVWQAITSSYDVLFLEADDHFGYVGFPKATYTEEDLLDSLPTLEDLRYVHNSTRAAEMTAEDVTTEFSHA